MKNYTPSWPHSDIELVFDNIYIVRGTNIIQHNEIQIQHSRNMLIINESGKLILINTVRLNDEGLKQLDKIGNVSHVIRIGAFHGRDDEFYLDKYNAKFWAFEETDKLDSREVDRTLNQNTKLPITGSKLFIFYSANPSEAVIYLERDNGIIITCDSIKNWVEVDKFFSKETGEIALKFGDIQKAKISPIWLTATGTTKEDFSRLMTLKFKHLISAHGDVLRDTADTEIQKSIVGI